MSSSTFTYCEGIPQSCNDLGKEQYGGPFTIEEVEDVETFARLLMLLVSLFRYHVAGDGFLLFHYMQMYSCPPSSIWGYIAFDPAAVSAMVVLIACHPNSEVSTNNSQTHA